MQRVSSTVCLEKVWRTRCQRKSPQGCSQLSGKSSRESIQLALVKTWQSRMEANVDEVVLDQHHLPHHLESVQLRGETLYDRWTLG